MAEKKYIDAISATIFLKAAEVAMREVNSGYNVDKEISGMEEAIAWLNRLPAADVQPVVHSEWRATNMYMVDECKECGFQMDWDDVPSWLESLPHFKDRCPACGAFIVNLNDE